jgi:hypothetical protein
MSDELWDAAKEKAARTLTPLTAVIRRLLEKWLRGEVDLEE